MTLPGVFVGPPKSPDGRSALELAGYVARLGGGGTTGAIPPEDVTFYSDPCPWVLVAAGAAGATALAIEYRRAGSGDAWAPLGLSDPVALSLASAGHVIGASVAIAVGATGDCEFRVVPTGGTASGTIGLPNRAYDCTRYRYARLEGVVTASSGSGEPAISALHLQFLEAPIPVVAPSGCHSGLVGGAWVGEDFCGFTSKAEVIAYYGEGAPHGTHPSDGTRSVGLTWTEEDGYVAPWQIVTDHPWNGGHTARRLTLPTSGDDVVFLHGLRADYAVTVPKEDRMESVWVRVRFTIPPAYDDPGGDNEIVLLALYGTTNEGPRIRISRARQDAVLTPSPDALQVLVSGHDGNVTFANNVHHTLGSVAELFVGGGVHELVVHVGRANVHDYRCRVWLGSADGSPPTLQLDYTQTIFWGPSWPFNLATVETMEAHWTVLPGVAHVIDHLETEIIDGALYADPFGIGG